MKKSWIWGAAGALVLAAGLGGAAWYGGRAGAGGAAAQAQAASQPGPGGGARDPSGKPVVPLEFIPSEVVQPQLASMPSVLEFSGPLVAPQTATVRARAAGTLLSLAVAEGSRVRAGQALGRIELAELDNRVTERGALVESARAALIQAERSHASNQRLAQQQFISGIALETSQAALDTARANLKAAQASLASTRVGLRDATLVAPISGIVAKRYALPGEKLSVEQQVLAIVDLARLELAGLVGTHEVAKIAPGMPVELKVEGVEQPVAGKISRLAPAVEPGTRSIGVAIELANPGERLRAGQYAVAKLVLADDVQRLTLPDTAVGKTSGQDHVWVIEGGVLARRAVTVGRRDEAAGRVELLQGVTPASQVLAARYENLREGAKAGVVAARGAPVASAAASTPLVR